MRALLLAASRRDVPVPRPRLEIRTLKDNNGQIYGLPEPIFGRWFMDDRYVDLRNAAWLVRNARWANVAEAQAIARLTLAVDLLMRQGEPLESVVPSLVDLFMRP